MKRSAGQNWLPSIFNDFFDNNWVMKANATAPAINVMETEKCYKVEVAAPGMCKDDFDIHINKDNDLVITMEKKCKCTDGQCENKDGEKREEKKDEEKEGRYLRREFSYSKFHQTLILPENADKDNVEAEVKDGVLHIRIPKIQTAKAEAEKRIIEVK